MGHKKISLPLAGLLQALGVAVYTGLVATFMWNMEKLNIEPNGIAGATLMLFLLVFSASVTGLLVFGYPVYLALDKKIKEALTLLGYTLLYCVLIFIIILLIVII